MDNAIVEHILSYTDSGAMYKAVCLVCKDWYQVARRLFSDGDVFANHLTTLLQLFPDADWDIEALSANPNINWEYVQARTDIQWSFKYLSLNPNITWDIVQSHPSPDWECLILVHNPNITVDIIQKSVDLFQYEPSLENPSITWEIFKSENLQHDNACLEINPNITWDIIQHAEQTEINWDWSYGYLSVNPNITWDIVQAHPDKDWNYGIMSCNPNITWDIVLANQDLDWDYDVLSANPNITWDITQSDTRLSKRFFSLNPNLTWRMVRDNPDCCDDFDHIKMHWDFGLLSSNVFNSKKYSMPSMTYKMIHMLQQVEAEIEAEDAQNTVNAENVVNV